MLLKGLRKINKDARIDILASLSGISAQRLYEINRRPHDHSINFKTLEKIYIATKKLYGVGLTPDKYLDKVVFKFNINE